MKKNLKGGNGNVFPSEYYGNNSGNYNDNSFSNPGEGAYGEYVPQSFGEPLSDSMSGPNMHVYPESTGLQTGGGNQTILDNDIVNAIIQGRQMGIPTWQTDIGQKIYSNINCSDYSKKPTNKFVINTKKKSLEKSDGKRKGKGKGKDDGKGKGKGKGGKGKGGKGKGGKGKGKSNIGTKKKKNN